MFSADCIEKALIMYNYTLKTEETFMKNALVVLEYALQYNYPFIAYLKRELKHHVGELETVHFIKKGDDDIVLVLEEVIAQHQNVFVVSTENFSFTGKIIATVCHDGLVLKDGMLIPLKAELFTKDSYLIKKGTTAINVLKVNVGAKLPKILIRNRTYTLSFYLFDTKKSKTVERIIAQLELNFEKVPLIEELLFYKVQGIHISQIDNFIDEINRSLYQHLLIGEDLSQIVCQRLLEANQTITTAESCTGGMLASEIVKNSGVSAIFAGSVVTYANEIKHKFLGVRENTLKQYGAVSSECVREMLHGVMQRFHSDFALAVSGVAGPTGGTRQKPVGTVYVGAKCRAKDIKIKKLSLKGDRTYIRESSVLWAFRLLVETNCEIFFKKVQKTLDK